MGFNSGLKGLTLRTWLWYLHWSVLCR